METALNVQYLPANGAWMVLWHDQRLAGPMPADALRQWLTDHGIDTSEVSAPMWMRKQWSMVKG